MILRASNPKDSLEMMKYGKTKGMILVNKYLPDLSLYKKLIIVRTPEEFDEIKYELPEKFFVRVDSPIGLPYLSNPGRWATKENAVEFIEEVNYKSKDSVTVCMDELDYVGDRIDTRGGFNIHFSIAEAMFIDYVGPGFDPAEITKGQAAHESWRIPYDDIPFLKSHLMTKYKVLQISNKEYKETIKKRKEVLLENHPERYEDIKKISKKYRKCSHDIFELILEQIIFPLWLKQDELINDKLIEFGVQLCITKENKLAVFEINRPERMKSIELEN